MAIMVLQPFSGHGGASACVPLCPTLRGTRRRDVVVAQRPVVCQALACKDERDFLPPAAPHRGTSDQACRASAWWVRARTGR